MGGEYKDSKRNGKEFVNLGYAFQSRDYYKSKDGFCNNRNNIANIINYKLKGNIVKFIENRKKEMQDLSAKVSDGSSAYSFTAKTVYPGLLIGMSNPTANTVQESDNNKNDKNTDFKTGFTFDYISGLPYIPGSSIKGILRDAMRKYQEDVIEYLKEDLESDDKIADLVKELFGDAQEDEGYSYTNTSKRDVFLDAVIIEGDNDKYILKDDYITPHSEFKDPVPIHILALRPDVKIMFYFIIRKDKIGGLDSSKRFNLYKDLLLDLGVGARTNIGYGSLEED